MHIYQKSDDIQVLEGVTLAPSPRNPRQKMLRWDILPQCRYRLSDLVQEVKGETIGSYS